MFPKKQHHQPDMKLRHRTLGTLWYVPLLISLARPEPKLLMSSKTYFGWKASLMNWAFHFSISQVNSV